MTTIRANGSLATVAAGEGVGVRVGVGGRSVGIVVGATVGVDEGKSAKAAVLVG